MVTSIESRLWLAVHLLYSNASQAFDVYQAVILQSEHAIANNDLLAVYLRLVQVYDKIPAIASTLSFYEFEFEEIDQWKVIYKNSQKTQLVIFVGMLIFELKINDIAGAVKLAPEKAQFLFHQIFKKLASTSQKLKYNEQLEFKKQNDNKISYLFTYENLVDYCLGQLNEDDIEKVKTGLKLYPMLQIAKEEYSRIISQIQNLRVQKERAVITSLTEQTSVQSVGEEVKTSPYSPRGLTKNQIKVVVIVFVVATTAVLIQPLKLLNQWNAKSNSIVLQQIEKPELIAAVTTPSPATVQNSEITEASGTQVVAAVEPTQQPTSQTQVAAVNETSPPTTPAVPDKPIAATNTAVPGAKYEGGLYRGTLYVKDIALSNEKIKEKISLLGATKAGEVALGWLKTPNLAYYHYTIPEVNIAEAEAYLKEVGQLQINFEKHPRKVPVGSRRFIIEVKQN